MSEEPTEEEELSDLHQAFVDEYTISRNATEAYQKVYDCTWESANANGPRLKKQPAIQVAIIEAMEACAKRCHIDQDWVLTNLKEGIERCMQHTPVLDKEGREAGEYTFQASPMFKGIELAGKNLGMFKEQHELSGTITNKYEGLPGTLSFLEGFRQRSNGKGKHSEESVQD